MLYLVATPIGNLGDLTFRAVDVLKTCDYILCEDTRHSAHLLRFYGIQRPLQSLHKFNEAKKELSIIADLKSGMQIAVISDAGTPGIADPGYRLVKACIADGIDVVAIPGPCAAVQALSCSGLSTERFQFLGFLPKKVGELRGVLLDILNYPGTTICYESPNRLQTVLEMIAKFVPERRLVVARELTKKFEEFRRGTAVELAAIWKDVSPKGEIVLLVEGSTSNDEQWAQWSPEEHVRHVQETYGVSKKEALKMVAELRGIPKRALYQLTIGDEDTKD